jgi:hypothetical protein
MCAAEPGPPDSCSAVHTGRRGLDGGGAALCFEAQPALWRCGVRLAPVL